MNERSFWQKTFLRSFFPALVLVGVAAIFVGGCSLTSLTAPLLTPDERQEQATQGVDEAVALLSKGETDEANALLKQVVILTQGDYGWVGQRLTEAGRPADAIRLLEPATKEPKVSDDPTLWATLAEAAEKQSDVQRALRARNEAESRAAALLKETVEKKPGGDASLEDVLRILRAGVYYSDFAKDAPSAITLYRAANKAVSDKSPVKPIVLNALGYALAEYGTSALEFEEAVQLTKKAVERAPESAIILDSYGWALYKRGDTKQNDFEAAWRVLREASDLAPKQAEIRYHLAVVYEKMGQNDSALIEVSRALERDQELKGAKELKERLLKIRGEFQSKTTPKPKE